LRANAADVPLVMGFGISSPEHVQQVSELVDGFIVGSALVKAGRDGVEPVRALTERLVAAARNG
jgi:tryptophan synthase alpha chain